MKTVNELMSLKDRVAVVTGGAGHIGSAICESLAECGAEIVIIDCNQDLCDEQCKKLEQDYGVKALPLTLDLADEKDRR
jgi:gluconate 5-dehydrogenase